MVSQSRHSILDPRSIAVAVVILGILGGLGTIITLSAQRDIQTQMVSERSEETFPNAVEGSPQQAQVLIEQGEPKGAQAILAAYLQKHPADVESRTKYAQALWQAGSERESLRQFERVIHSQPPKSILLYQVGLINRQAGKEERSLELLRQAAALEPNSMVFNAELAKGYVTAGRYAEAIQAWKRALRFSPRQTQIRSTIYAQLGLTYEQARKPADARQTYKTGLNQDPKNSYLSKLLSELNTKRP